MANFFLDHPDLSFHFNRLDLEFPVKILEENFSNADKYPGAPANYNEAVENFRGALELAGNLAADHIHPHSPEIDRKGATLANGKVKYAEETTNAYRKLGEAGITGVIIPHRFGGLNFPATIYMMIIEMISRADASMMTLIGYQDVGEAISKFADPEIAMRFLPPYATGKHIGSMVMTEPGAGSDLQSIKLKAYQDEEGQWRLQGVKHFISNGCGDMLLVLAKSEPNANNMFGLSLFVCPGGEKVQVNHVEEKMGLHGSPTCQLYFDDAPCYLVGKRRQGLLHVLYVLNHARFSVAAQGLGIAEAAYHEAIEYTRIREQFKRIIYDIPAVGNMLIQMRVAIESSRSLLYAGAQWLDHRNTLEEHLDHLKKNGEDFSDTKQKFDHAARITDLLSPLTKYIVTEMAVKVCYDAQQLHGGMGYMREMRIEQLVRDVRITTIYEGTSQIHIAASYKSVKNDVLAAEFEKLSTPGNEEITRDLYKKVARLREIDVKMRSWFNEHTSVKTTESAAKVFVDNYAKLYQSYLILNEVDENPRKKQIARRFINEALSSGHGALESLYNGQFDDLEDQDLICQL